MTKAMQRLIVLLLIVASLSVITTAIVTDRMIDRIPGVIRSELNRGQSP